MKKIILNGSCNSLPFLLFEDFLTLRLCDLWHWTEIFCYHVFPLLILFSLILAPQEDKKGVAEHARGFDTTAEETACSKVKQPNK